MPHPLQFSPVLLYTHEPSQQSSGSPAPVSHTLPWPFCGAFHSHFCAVKLQTPLAHRPVDALQTHFELWPSQTVLRGHRGTPLPHTPDAQNSSFVHQLPSLHGSPSPLPAHGLTAPPEPPAPPPLVPPPLVPPLLAPPAPLVPAAPPLAPVLEAPLPDEPLLAPPPATVLVELDEHAQTAAAARHASPPWRRIMR